MLVVILGTKTKSELDSRSWVGLRAMNINIHIIETKVNNCYWLLVYRFKLRYMFTITKACSQQKKHWVQTAGASSSPCNKGKINRSCGATYYDITYFNGLYYQPRHRNPVAIDCVYGIQVLCWSSEQIKRSAFVSLDFTNS